MEQVLTLSEIADEMLRSAARLTALSLHIDSTPRFPFGPVQELLDQARFEQGYSAALRTVAGMRGTV